MFQGSPFAMGDGEPSVIDTTPTGLLVSPQGKYYSFERSADHVSQMSDTQLGSVPLWGETYTGGRSCRLKGPQHV